MLFSPNDNTIELEITQFLIGVKYKSKWCCRQVFPKSYLQKQLILEQKGLPLSKVAILVGGPDWPTSVLQPELLLFPAGFESPTPGEPI